MKRRIIGLAVSVALGLSLTVTPAIAHGAPVGPPLAHHPGLGHDCPGIVWGDGVYYDQYWPPPFPDDKLTGSTTYVNFYIHVGDLATDTPTASCRQAWYTIAVLPTDAAGEVLSNRPIFSRTWKGDGLTYEYTAEHYFRVRPPAGLCVYATSQIGSNVIHYAPSDDPTARCMWLQLDPPSNPGRTFRG